VASLSGRVVVVAQADCDKGADLAARLAAAGAALVLTGDDAARLGALATSLRDAHGVRVAVYAGDAADDALAELVTELFGPNGHV
jgi:short-subunit dehydrogenase